MLPLNCINDYLNWIYFIHQNDRGIYNSLFSYSTNETKNVIRSKLYPLNEHRHIPWAYYYSSLSYKKYSKFDEALHTLYNAMYHLEQSPQSHPFEYYFVNNQIISEFGKIYDLSKNALILSELFSLSTDLSHNILQDINLQNNYKDYCHNREILNEEVEKISALASAASTAEFYSNLKLLTSLAATAYSNNSKNLDAYMTTVKDWTGTSDALTESIKNVMQNISIEFNLNDSLNFTQTSLNSKGEFIAKSVMKFILMKDNQLRAKNLSSLQNFSIDKPNLYSLVKLIIEKEELNKYNLDTLLKDVEYITTIKKIASLLSLIEKACYKYELKDQFIPLNISSKF
ncbi:MAG: hypothetical protein IPO16_14665 [Saprospiraceae bacterium]|nr:hypothetical protein [Saprospiraceae bacterium]